LTRKAVELARVGDPSAMRLCLERILPACRERSVKFALPPIESAADIAAAMKAVTSALAEGAITPGEAATLPTGRSRRAISNGACSSSRTTSPAGRRPEAGAGRGCASTFRGGIAVDWLQIQRQ
jgi:hypothetical protein